MDHYSSICPTLAGSAVKNLVTDALAFTGALVKVIRFGFYPSDKAGYARVGQKRLNVVVSLCEFSLCQ